MKPLHPKVKAGGIAGALTTLIVAVANRAHLNVTAEEAAALVVVITGIFAWFTPSQP